MFCYKVFMFFLVGFLSKLKCRLFGKMKAKGLHLADLKVKTCAKIFLVSRVLMA